MTPKLFISYRRGDSADVVGRIDDYLTAEFGRGNVFKDVDSIALGTDFRKVLGQAVSRCDLLIAVVGPGWLDAADEHGRRRLDSDADYVRIEVETALRRDIPVIPVLLGATPMVRPEQFPDSTREFAYRSGTHVRPDPDFRGDMDRVVGAARGVLRAGAPGRPPDEHEAPPEPRARRLWVWMAAAALAGAIVGALLDRALALKAAPDPRGRGDDPVTPAVELSSQFVVAVTKNENGRPVRHHLDLFGPLGKRHVMERPNGVLGAAVPVLLRDEPDGVTGLAAAGAGRWLHLAIVDREGRVWHALRKDRERWGGWFPIPMPYPMTDVAIAADPDEQVELYASGRDGRPPVRMRLRTDGQWIDSP